MPIQIADIATYPEGMNTQMKPWAIPEGQARYLQDIVLHREMEAARRGPVTEAFVIPSDLTKSGVGIVGTRKPDDSFKIGVLNGSASASDALLSVLADAHTSYTTHVQFDQSGTAVFDPAKRYHISVSEHPESGIIIGTSNGLKSGTQQNLFAWAGAGKPFYNTGTITVTQDGTTVTGSGTSWTANAEAGMYLYGHADIKVAAGQRAFFGVVKTVNSDTSITLVDGSLYAATARAYALRPTRPIEPRVCKGTITCATGAKKVTGAGTKFSRQGLNTAANSGVWAIFRADDMKYVGKVNAVQSDIQLTLVDNATVNCNKDKYVAINIYTERDTVLTQANDPGFLSARYANRQWYANRGFHGKNTSFPWSRVFFSDIIDPQGLDTTADGDHFLIPSSTAPLKPITGMATSPQCLLVFKQDETYGVFGTDPTNFSVRKIVNDGAISNMTIQKWNDGVVWAGMKGVWFFDGSQAYNLLEDRIVDFYEKSMENVNTNTESAWSLIDKGNYIVYLEGATPEFGPDKTANDTNGVGTPQDHLCLCINLDRRACTLFTNFAFRGSVVTPYEETLGTLYLVNKTNTTTPWALVGARIGKANDLFYTTGLDTIFTQVPNGAVNSLGPDLYIESKRYDIQQPQLKKRMKQIQMNYLLESTTGNYVTNGYTGTGVADYDDNYLKFATLVGLNNVATISNSKWRLTRIRNTAGNFVLGFQNKRIKFNKRSQHIGFRIWQSNLTGIKSVKIGPQALGWRPMRPGRV